MQPQKYSLVHNTRNVSIFTWLEGIKEQHMSKLISSQKIFANTSLYFFFCRSALMLERRHIEKSNSQTARFNDNYLSEYYVRNYSAAFPVLLLKYDF